MFPMKLLVAEDKPRMAALIQRALQRLRAANQMTPVIMVSARDTMADIVNGLDAGADNHLTKPFPFDILQARVRALARRGPLACPDDLWRCAAASASRARANSVRVRDSQRSPLCAVRASADPAANPRTEDLSLTAI
jgi:DNA-binding response OmpR family regulator